MNGLQRISAVLQGRFPDRVPVICTLFEQGAAELGMSIQEYYARGEHVAEGQIRLREKYGYDLVWAFSYMGFFAELLGCRKMIYAEDGPPNVGHLLIRDFHEIERLEFPESVEDLPAFQKWRQCFTILQREYTGRYPVATLMLSSFTLPSILMGTERWLELLLLGPATLRDELLQKCSRFCETLLNTFLSLGVDLIAYVNPMASSDMLTLSQFQTLALPWIQRDLARLNSLERLLYFCGGGRINPTIPLLIEQAGFSAFYLHPFDDLRDARKMIGKNGVHVGTINDINLLSWTEEEIRHEVRGIMQRGAPGAKFLFGTIMVPYAATEERIKAMLDAAYRYGEYNHVLHHR